MKKILTTALLSSLLASSAFAGDTGAYLSAELGSATLKNASPFPNPGTIGFAAGYRFSPNIAAELGYTIFGDSTIISGGNWVTMKLSSFHPAVVGMFPITEQISVFGKLGLAMNSEKYTSNLSLTTSSYSQNSTYLAIGGQYNISQQMGIRVQYESFGDFDNVPPPYSATAVSIGIAYNF